MSDKYEKNNHSNQSAENEELKELRGLEDEVVNRLKSDPDFESKMIANFNAKVNSNFSADSAPKDEEELKKGENSQESGGPKGLEPTRYGDWERKGRCSDF